MGFGIESLVVPVLALLVAAVSVFYRRADKSERLAERVATLEANMVALTKEMSRIDGSLAGLHTTIAITASAVSRIEGALALLKQLLQQQQDAIALFAKRRTTDEGA